MFGNEGWRAAAGGLVLVTMLGMACGCSTGEDRQASRHAELVGAGRADEASDLFRVDVALQHRAAGGRWRTPAEPVFPIRDDSQVKAAVTLEPLRPGRTYSVHLVWIRPDGREMFRRYAEVTRHEVSLPPGVLPDSTGALPASWLRQHERRWGHEQAGQLAALLAADPAGVVGINDTVFKKPMDVQFAQHRLEIGGPAQVSLESRLDISRERERTPGLYLLRVYLDRRLLHEVPFTVSE